MIPCYIVPVYFRSFMSLPLCPCPSGKPYEDCCFKIIGEDGERLYFKGTSFSGTDGIWHPEPNVRLWARVHVTTVDKYRTRGESLATRSRLAAQHHEKFINAWGLFQNAQEKLIEQLLSSGGKGVSFQVDSLDARERWRNFLFNGRTLLDFAGLHTRGILIKQDLGGLNARTFESLLIHLTNEGAPDQLTAKNRLELLKDTIVFFIDVRDKEKAEGNTLLSFPSIFEGELEADGEVSGKTGIKPLLQFIRESSAAIEAVAKELLKIEEVAA